MIRKTDKYLLLFILMIVLSLKLNAESVKHFFSAVDGHRSSVISQPPTINRQPSTVNSQLPTANCQLLQDTLPILKTRHHFHPASSSFRQLPGPPVVVGNIDVRVTKSPNHFTVTRELPFKPGDSLTLPAALCFSRRLAEHPDQPQDYLTM